MINKKTRWGVSGDAILLMAIKFVTIALGLAITRLLSEYLTVYDYGTYSQILLIVKLQSLQNHVKHGGLVVWCI